MKKLLVLMVALFSSFIMLRAQKFLNYVSLDVGPMYNLYENIFAYGDNGKVPITYQASLTAGLNYNKLLGIRMQIEAGQDTGVCNVLQTSGGGFYPYSFYNANIFFDAMLDLAGLELKMVNYHAKLYGGVGLGYTFGFSDPGHPWQEVKPSNLAAGFRLGGTIEYVFPSGGWGLIADLCAEAFTDNYNGLLPSPADRKRFEGYPGFPLDLRFLAKFGAIYYF